MIYLFLIPAIFIIIVIPALVFCIACDRIENRWRLRKIKRKLELLHDSTEAEFLRSFPDENREVFSLMRKQLASLLSVVPEKIHADWSFSHETDIQRFIPMIYAHFARAYAPASLSNLTFQFPKRNAQTVKELFLEAADLKNREHLL